MVSSVGRRGWESRPSLRSYARWSEAGGWLVAGEFDPYRKDPATDAATQRTARAPADPVPLRGERKPSRCPGRIRRTARQRGWWDAYASNLPTDYATYIGLEAEAESLNSFTMGLVHGLIQTEEYAHHMSKSMLMRFSPPAEVDRRHLVRDSKDPDGGVLVLADAAWRTFIEEIKSGTHDL